MIKADITISHETLLEILNGLDDSGRKKKMKEWAAKQAEKIRLNAQDRKSDGSF
jgi:hypothetical protein